VSGPPVEIEEVSPGFLADYGRIATAFEVTSVLAVVPADGGLGGLAFEERPAPAPFVKDYDALPGNRPVDWLRRFDVARWGVLVARRGGRVVGGAVLAFDTPGMTMLDGRSDLAVLWDLRVEPGARGQGVGTALFEAAEHWARARSCRRLKVETQNVNVPACRFYAARGCTLGAIHRFAYAELPGEVQLLWYRELGAERGEPTGP
jgi:GNAT superfamily N-acetyltransferase